MSNSQNPSSSSNSIINIMDVDGADTNGSNTGGVEDWTQHESIFNSPHSITGSSAMPPPPTTANHVLGQTPSPNAQGSVISPRPLSTARQTPAQRESMPHSITGAPSSAAGTAPAAQTARSKEREQLMNGPLMFRTPLSIATIVIHGREFFIHASLLCKNSDYFTRCLRGGFAEAETQRVEINDDDISAEDFGLWVDLLYRSHFQKPGSFVLRKEETGGTLSTMQILTLWKLSDRFMNRVLAQMAEESLQHRLSLYSIEQWRKLYRTRPSNDIRSRVSRLQDAYRYCVEQELPFVNDIVNACANCPAQVYAECASLFEVDFMMLVSQRMIMAHADSALISKDQRISSGTKTNGNGAATNGNRTASGAAASGSASDLTGI